MIRILLVTVFRTPELVYFDQITIIGVDPLLGSDLPVVLVLDVYPFFEWTFFPSNCDRTLFPWTCCIGWGAEASSRKVGRRSANST